MSGLESYQPKDRFSRLAQKYAAFRPTYPLQLYDLIISQVDGKDVAWDCATGNGQVAADLAKVFKKVLATDISAQQIENAVRLQNVEYSISQAHESGFPESTIDLITVGQAIHWFDISAFYEEVKRVARPGALLAVWGYSLLKINPEVDSIISDFYVRVIGPYWDAERKLIDDHYQTIPFPFDEIKTPELNISIQWTLAELEGYLSTWSSVQKYIQTTHEDPVDELMRKIGKVWREERYAIAFPLFLRMGRI